MYWPVISAEASVQAHYEACRKNGCTHELAEMLATRSFPGTKGTDRAFMEGRHRDGSQFEGLPDIVGKEYVRKALAAGVNPAGKYYSGTLARFPGDPRAWIDGLDDARRVAKERGVGLSGAINVKTPEGCESRDPAPYRVADDIVQRHVANRVADEPALADRREDLAAELSTRLSGSYGQKKG